MEGTSPPASRSHQVLTGLTILFLVYIGASVAVGLGPVLPQIRADFAGSPGADFLTKALVTVFGISALIGSPLAGSLLARWGPRTLMLAMTIAFIASGLAGMAAPSLIVLLLTRFVAGLAAAITATVYYTLVLTQFPPGKRERWLGFIGTAGAVWAVVASVLAGELGHFGWRFAFLIHLIALPLLVMIPLAFREAIVPPDRPEEASAPPAAGILRMAPAVIVGLLSGAVVMSSPVYLPFHFSAAGVTDPRAIAKFMAWYSSVSAGTALLYGFVRRRLSVAGVNVFAFTVTGAGYLSLALWPASGLQLLELAVLGMGTGLLTPNLAAFAGRRGDAIEKARSIGIAKAGYFASAFAFQSVLGAIAIKSADGSLIALALVCVPGAMMMLAARPTPPRTSPAG